MVAIEHEAHANITLERLRFALISSRHIPMRGLVLWILGVPISLIILLYLVHVI